MEFWAALRASLPLINLYIAAYLLGLLLLFYFIFVKDYLPKHVWYILNLLDVTSECHIVAIFAFVDSQMVFHV